jgi:hypothetical protein
MAQVLLLFLASSLEFSFGPLVTLYVLVGDTQPDRTWTDAAGLSINSTKYAVALRK